MMSRVGSKQAGGLFYVVLSAWALAPSTTLAVEAKFDTKAYVQTHCIRCHGGEEQNADRRFDRLGAEPSDHQTADRHSAEQWQEILDVINLGEMPPEDEPQPTAEETKRFVATVTRQLEAAREALATRGQESFRRLNRYEYRNTIRDLLGINMDSFDPTTSFPADDRVDGFDNIGESLVLSDYLLQCYLEAASRSVDKAVQSREVVAPINKVLRAKDFSNRKFLFRPEQRFIVNPTGDYVDVAHSDPSLARLHAKRFRGVPADGYYTIRVQAEGVHREHPYPPGTLRVDRDEPIKMQIIASNPKVAPPGTGQNSSDRIVATVSLADHQSKVYEFRTWMDKEFVPVIRYANGPINFRTSLVKLVRKYHPETKTSNWLDVFSTEPSENLDVWMSDAYQGPRMRIHQMEIAGPEPKDETKPDWFSVARERSLEPFMFRAFRRQPLDSEVARYESFFQSRMSAGDSEETAFLTTCKAILCSPSFLYVETPPDAAQSDNRAFQLASRLSYFLWSSMPDEQLFRAAAGGNLSEPETLLAQTRRMLRDPRAEAFIENFTNSWLRLNELGSQSPCGRVTHDLVHYEESQLASQTIVYIQG
ncbi:DUF1592 domain-containing protein [Rhodopirellula europaea]|uniref:Secreted protein containing DUF1587 n=1 Tax=Rhodopirellula europaea 6C TaxID=1263867 RepID=M2AZD9_9BACT|nr:DUF1592 domain-containing protein [Rhodopirellula europaea]EMB14918.1 secreted protein containing DUF1587 [Rhodopirellula europaea 6C]